MRSFTFLWRILAFCSTFGVATISLLASRAALLSSVSFDSLATNPDEVIDRSLVTDSSTATVISFAFGYSLNDFKRFVGSLRATGYTGHVILGISPDTAPEVLSYLEEQNVTSKILHYVPCSHGYNLTGSSDDTRKSLNTCIFPYSDIKMRWSKYPLGRDWLQQCQTCVGPVLFSDFRDLVFQRDPFLGEHVTGLQVFEEHPDLDNTHWLTYHMILPCKGIEFPSTPMLCSGTTVGTRAAMLDYLTKMHSEMRLWVATKSCHLESDADDQAMHNYLFYFQNHSNALRNVRAVPHQTGIVNTIGYQAARVWARNEKSYSKGDQLTAKEKAEMDFTLDTDHDKTWLKRNLTDSEGYFIAVDGKKSRWGKPYLTDEQGRFVNLDGTLSRVIHQIDRFGPPLSHWLDRKPFMSSKLGSKTVFEQTQQRDISAIRKWLSKMTSGEVESLAFLIEKLADMTVYDDEIIQTVEEERCARYGWKLQSPAVRRRIFLGSLIADDSWHPIAITAMEVFGLYHHVAFAESNRTQSYVPRGWRFPEGSSSLRLLQKEMFGPETRVTMDYYIDEDTDNRKDGLLYENLQRDMLLRRWSQEGMTAGDIGLIADVDESFTRDFLRAVQICDVPELRPGQSCKHPKVLASSVVFEGSPNCLSSNRRWHHPDMMLGECIEFIGNEKKHPPVPAEKRDDWGLREKGYNPDDEELNNSTAFPLWNAADFRMTAGGKMYVGVNGENTGYHVHNFFETEDSLRFKYKTYGHPQANADTLDLESIDDDLKVMVKCSSNISDEGDGDHRETRDITADKALILPLALQFREYREMRHQELVRMVEKRYGKAASKTEAHAGTSVMSGPVENAVQELKYLKAEIMTLEEVGKIVRDFDAKRNFKHPSFSEIGRLLLKHATETNKLLMTVQIGGYDGKSNDPMFEMFVEGQKTWSLNNWLPIVVEPVPANFEALTKTYKEISVKHGLSRSVLKQWAISYDQPRNDRTCTFCRFDTSDNADPYCKEKPDWMKFQLGTLDCDYSRAFFNYDFDRCIVQDEVRCGTSSALFDDVRLPVGAIAILQVDVEGYEAVLIPALLNELSDSDLPPVIHFENKVMIEKDEKRISSISNRTQIVYKALRRHGYAIFDQGEDTLCLRV